MSFMVNYNRQKSRNSFPDIGKYKQTIGGSV